MNGAEMIRPIEGKPRIGRRMPERVVLAVMSILGGAGVLMGASVSDEASLTKQIKELMRDPAPGQDRRDYMTVLADRREEVIKRVDALLEAYPQTQRRDELLMARLESVYVLAVVKARPLDALAAEADRILTRKPSPDLAAYAAYVKMRIKIAADRRQRRIRALATRQAPATTVATTDQERFAIRQYLAYVSVYPKSEFAPPLFGTLIRDAWERGDRAAARKYLAELKRLHPRHVETERMAAADQARRAVGKPFELTLTSTAGETIDVRKMTGHVVVVGFWATWCSNCRRTVRRLESMDQRWRSRGLRIIGISLDDSRSALDTFIEQEGITWPVCFDGKQWDSDVARRFGIRAIPTVYVIDRSGVLRSISPGDIEAFVERLLAQNALEHRSRRP